MAQTYTSEQWGAMAKATLIVTVAGLLAVIVLLAMVGALASH
jgi:hypothetical protein